MTKEEYLSVGVDLIYLARCAICEKTPELSRISAMDLSAVFSLAGKHLMEVVSYFALEDAIKAHGAIGIDPKLLSKWKEAKNRAVRKIILFDSEREQIFKFMDEHKIWHMPLKGIVLQSLYPKFGMRQITDNDIFFDENHRDELRDYMVSRGYKYKKIGQTIHDIYLKPPILNFEMHVSLSSFIVNEAWYNYYLGIKERLVKDGEYSYRFTPEDLYIYSVVHALKHHHHGGNGIRCLMDSYLFVQKLGDSLDRDYIAKELDKISAADYESQLRRISVAVFSEDFDVSQLSEEDLSLLVSYISSGAFGTVGNQVKSELQTISGETESISFGTKMKFLKSKLFPPEEYYIEAHPFLYRHRIFIPFFLIYRTVSALFRKRNYIKLTLKALFKKKK